MRAKGIKIYYNARQMQINIVYINIITDGNFSNANKLNILRYHKIQRWRILTIVKKKNIIREYLWDDR